MDLFYSQAAPLSALPHKNSQPGRSQVWHFSFPCTMLIRSSRPVIHSASESDALYPGRADQVLGGDSNRSRRIPPWQTTPR